MQICIQTKLLTFVSVIRWVTCVGWPNKVILWQRQASSKLMYTHDREAQRILHKVLISNSYNSAMT